MEDKSVHLGVFIDGEEAASCAWRAVAVPAVGDTLIVNLRDNKGKRLKRVVTKVVERVWVHEVYEQNYVINKVELYCKTTVE